jgi:hypothetical protein
MTKSVRAAAAAGCAWILLSYAYAQRGSQDWMTIGADAQRSSWVRSDPKIFLEAMQKGGFALLWKMKLKNESRQLNTITPPALIDFYISYRGFRTLGGLLWRQRQPRDRHRYGPGKARVGT